MFELECDDGNLVDGDGCSSNCTIETDFACINGSASSASVCSYNGSHSIQLKTGDKDPDRNAMTLVYDLGASAISTLMSLQNGSADITSLISFPGTIGITVT